MWRRRPTCSQAEAMTEPLTGPMGAPMGDQLPIVSGSGFSGWHALNDTIMGGRSSAACSVSAKGLVLAGEVVEAGGGFVSCRSPLFSPPLDLSAHRGLKLLLRGGGRRFKLAIASADGLAGLTELIPGGLRWVHEFATAEEGLSDVDIPFSDLKPSLRAQPMRNLPFARPLQFDPARISRLQLLHSRFGDDGGANPGFRPGPFRLELLAIHALD
jgi:hypothetical protein